MRTSVQAKSPTGAPLTLGDLIAFVGRAATLGVADDAVVSGRVTLGGKLREVRVDDDQAVVAAIPPSG